MYYFKKIFDSVDTPQQIQQTILNLCFQVREKVRGDFMNIWVWAREIVQTSSFFARTW